MANLMSHKDAVQFKVCSVVLLLVYFEVKIEFLRTFGLSIDLSILIRYIVLIPSVLFCSHVELQP